MDRRIFCRVLLAALAMQFPYAALAEEETLETVLAVWRKREAAVTSVRVAIEEDYVTGKGAHGPGSPAADQLNKLRIVVAIDGTKMRHERVGGHWAMGFTGHLTYYDVFDGTRSKSLWRITRDRSVIQSRGWIRNADKPGDLHNINLSPVLRHFRPQSPVFGLFRDGLKLIGTDERLNGARCLVLEEEHAHWTRKYWVAPDQEMAIVRLADFRPDGTMTHQVDAKYKRDPKHGWLPTLWKGVNRDGDKLRSSADATRASTLTNLSLPPRSTFSFRREPSCRTAFEKLTF